ncbi:UNVERIFIED_CONTAM: phosphatase PAP2 family protein [Streptococcus canis]|uniref:phosphatase PAP2 family protein n=1 Tax=Streptococcus canis TaxID=1329 RepID=UPI000F6EE4CE|nr:phosphatase PAP2 family protein [Streptococcus canis]MDV5987712.1 phosphatase PAP2 family protein [Streptococcus canis]MDV5993614.1 phosphatase PAP2 family protein [Streptococcus canis]MDV6001333.1 phosphatase PAP2 family protein [Streptococcus canis]MDV6022851.1 phosphatase PAP2 family protein [Streptococcus canis]MDW7798445.1 phosphatase PAP2 family protein [Streptococcus canis]
MMKNKQNHFLIASFALLLFVMIGYTVKFFPESLTTLDSSIQATIRGNLPQAWTQFFKGITVLGNVSAQLLLVVLSVLVLLLLKWKIEALLVLSNGVVAAVLISSLKWLYQRPRPSIEHLVHAGGFSFPSGHSMGSMLIFGSLLIICHQRIISRSLRLVVDTIFITLILLIGLSRIYLGVHYPSDVLAGFILGFSVLHFLYPCYNQKRFEWRFLLKQD